MRTFLTLLLKTFPVFAVLLCSIQVKAATYNAVVDINGTGDYTTIQAALDAAPSSATSPYRIYIKNGIYYENLTIAKPFIQFIGESAAKTIITYDNYSGKAIPAGGNYGTANSASVIISANDFSAANITFQNTTGDAPQALAINVSGDRASFKNCRFLGGQDTFLGYNSKYPQSLYKCYIEGVVDFIFGNTKTVFDECTIYPRDLANNLSASYITASNTREDTGFIFRNCEIINNRGVTKFYLGRPWQNDANTTTDKATSATTFINTKMSDVVKPEGWSVWDAGTDVSKVLYSEYGSTDMDGNALDVSSRVSWSKQLSSSEAAGYLDNSIVFKDRNNNVWDPYAVFLDGNTVPTNRLAISNFKYIKSGTELTFSWNLDWPESNVTYKLYRIANGGSPVLINEQTIADDNVNISYAPATGKETVPPSMSTYTYYVEASSANGTVSSDSVSIASVPTITAGVVSGTFQQGSDGPSTTKVYTLAAESLSDNLIITPPANFEVSGDNGVTWHNAASPLSIAPTNGAVSATISVRLNTADATGTYNGNIVHTSANAASVNVAVAGTKVNYSLTDLKELIRWDLTTDNSASAVSTGVTATAPTFNNLVLSDGTTVAAVPAYSVAQGQAFAATAAGEWGAGAGGPGGNLNRNFYEEFTVTPVSGKMLTVQELLLNTNFYNTSSNTKIGVSYSLDDFTTINEITAGYDANNVSLGTSSFGSFTSPAAIGNNTSGTTQQFRFVLNGDDGVVVPSGKILKVRLYFSCSSSSTGRYGKLKSVYFKGAVDPQPVAGDFRTISSGSWDDVSIWQKYDGTSWNAVTAYPVYNSGGTSYIEKGHSVILPTLSEGYGYCNNFYVKAGATLTIPAGNSVNFANQSPNFYVDGEFINNGTIGNNGAYSITVNSGGTFRNAGVLNNAGNATMNVYGTYEHAANSNTLPGTVTFADSSTFLISGITTSQTGILNKNISYYNVTWDNPGETNYYAFQGNLVQNIRGKFTVNNTGSSYIALLNAGGTIGLGNYEQNGGRVLVRENGTVNAVLNVAGDFIVNAGTFESNAAASVKINLNGDSSKYKYDDATNLLNGLNVAVANDCTLQSPLTIDALSVGNGRINLGDNNLTTSAITRTGTGYVVTDGSGTLTVKNIGTTEALLPIGTATGYNPLIISNNGAVSDFAASVKSTIDNTLPGDASKSVNLQWDITPAISGAKADITFQWNAADQNSGFSTASPVVAANYHNGSYVGYAATVNGSDPYTAKITGIESFSPFVIANEQALPLKMLSFTAGLTQQPKPSVLLAWQTSDEINTAGFEIERAGANLVFAKIGAQAAFNTAGTHNYSFTDETPLAGISYYRIRQTDLDGKYSYSDTRTINNAASHTLALYPNPASKKLNIQCGKIEINVLIRIINAEGRVVFSSGTINMLSTPYTVDVSGLASGLYFVVVTSGNEKVSGSFIKQ